MEEDDDAGWENWDVETDSSESDSEGWMDVSSDGEDLEVSDSEDEKEAPLAQARDSEKGASEADKDIQAQDNPISTLATTKVNLLWSSRLGLTPATDSDTCRFRTAQRSPYQSRDKGSRKRRRFQGQTQTCRPRGLQKGHHRRWHGGRVHNGERHPWSSQKGQGRLCGPYCVHRKRPRRS